MTPVATRRPLAAMLRNRWPACPECAAKKTPRHEVEEVGIDLGLKTCAVLSDGSFIENKTEFRKLEERLGKAQRAHKKKLAANIQAKRTSAAIFYTKRLQS